VSTLVVIVGGAFTWVIVPVALWVLLAALYIYVPLVVFGRIAQQAKDRRINEARSIVEQRKSSPDAGLWEWEARSEIQQVSNQKVRLLRGGPHELPPTLVAVVLPIALGGIQLYLSLKFGVK